MGPNGGSVAKDFGSKYSLDLNLFFSVLPGLQYFR